MIEALVDLPAIRCRCGNFRHDCGHGNRDSIFLRGLSKEGIDYVRIVFNGHGSGGLLIFNGQNQRLRRHKVWWWGHSHYLHICCLRCLKGAFGLLTGRFSRGVGRFSLSYVGSRNFPNSETFIGRAELLLQNTFVVDVKLKKLLIFNHGDIRIHDGFEDLLLNGNQVGALRHDLVHSLMCGSRRFAARVDGLRNCDACGVTWRIIAAQITGLISTSLIIVCAIVITQPYGSGYSRMPACQRGGNLFIRCA